MFPVALRTHKIDLRTKKRLHVRNRSLLLLPMIAAVLPMGHVWTKFSAEVAISLPPRYETPSVIAVMLFYHVLTDQHRYRRSRACTLGTRCEAPRQTLCRTD